MEPNVQFHVELCQDIFMNIGKRLVQERKRLGLSQTDFAKQVGVSISSQKRYESGEREPDTGYLKRIINLGVDANFILTNSRGNLEFPSMAAQIALIVFKRFNTGLFPGAMEALFYILGLDLLNREIQEESNNLSSEDIDLLINIATERGELFYEAFRSITYFLTDIESPPILEKSAYLIAKLVFKTIGLYDEVKDQFAHVSLHDNIRLVAQQIVKSYGDLAVKKE